MYKNQVQANAFHEMIPVAGVAHRNLTVSNTALALVAPLNEKTRYVLVSVNTEGVRVTFDGSAPTSTDGHLLAAGSERLLSREMAVALKMIRSGGTDANVTVTELSR